ncbi:HlyD family efflux transporter periplasmic adaptor subunit [Marispirochaeta aestuarii]|uniref:efflux RND transporter periplasmic adaptor subunit n=1 Tax=Marispirochaeta aestuarii TaxID=1963862 RepID=UPI0029C60891|nr:HlyD family efflux transporter periplasmic adaptor subunit [Marispirochaeta aestuarii]
MKRYRTPSAARHVAAFALVLAFWLVFPLEAQQGGGAGRGGAGGPGAGESALIGTASVESRGRVIQVGGRLKPKTSIVHTSTFTGVVRDIPVEPGDSVSTGELLFTVDRNEAGQTFQLHTVRSRIDGIVSKVDLLAEEEVSANGAGVTVIGRREYILEAKISDKDAFKVALGQQVSGRRVDGGDLTGRLSLRSPEPDYDTGLFELTFEFPAGPQTFAGAFVLIDLPTELIRGIFVPSESIDRRYGRNFLWLVDPDTRTLIRREVELGTSLGDETLINAGLAEGDRYLRVLSGREQEGAPLPEGGR